MKNSKEIRSGKKPLDEISFISLESHLSQLYSAYENHWHCMLWLKFNLIEFDTEKKIYILEQPKSELEVACEVSQIRKSRLASHQASITSSPEIQQFYNNDKYLSIVRKGRKKTLKCLSISNSDDEIKYINSNWKTATLFLQDNFEINTLKSSHNNGFSIIEALDVFRLLILLSTILIRRFPEDDSVYNFKKSSEFCPKIKKKDLINSTARATGLELKKIENIIDFIEYKALKKQDLSCHPIIKISESHYGILTSALVAPVITRIVEHWLVALDIDLQSKGKIYEDIILKNLNDAVRENKTIINFDDAVSRRIKLKNGAEEEIDLIMKIGNLILIGEAKSIVTTDSPISNYRTLETLRYASEQALRKTKFVKNNILDVFKKLDWIFSPETEYSFVNFIINSGRIYVGHNINGVPICDEKILIKYFTDNNIPLLSITDEKTQRHKHLAWIDLYNNFENLQSNLLSYLIDPPQIVDTMEHFDYKYNRLPYINKNSYKVVFKRLVIKDIPIMERLKPKKFVNMKKCHDFDNEIKKIDITI